MPNNKLPINRVNKFFSSEDFELEKDFGREWLENDINIKIILYQVDRDATQSDDIYNEADQGGIRTKPPVEVVCNFQMEQPENKAYNPNNTVRFKEFGNLKIGVYQDHLDELGVDIRYGDYIGYVLNETKIKYFTVVEDGKINYDNQHTIAGYKGFYRSIIAAPTVDDVFKG
jgi:hypothetical protein